LKFFLPRVHDSINAHYMYVNNISHEDTTQAEQRNGSKLQLTLTNRPNA